MPTHHVVLASLTVGSHTALATLCWMLIMFHVYAEHGIRAASKPHSKPWEGLCSGPHFRTEKTETHRVSCITPPKDAVGKWKSQSLKAELTDSKVHSSFIMLFWMVMAWSVERVCWGCVTGRRGCVGKSRGWRRTLGRIYMASWARQKCGASQVWKKLRKNVMSSSS